MDNNIRLRPHSVNIVNFRRFKDVSFELGNKITVISGQNGVGKSNLLSLIASGSGVSKKSILGSNFQPEFYEYFNIELEEGFENYQIFITYNEDDNKKALTKRLSFKNDTKSNRKIRVIPRAAGMDGGTVKDATLDAKNKYGIGGAARVTIPTIYLSLSRMYPLGEKKDTVKVTDIERNTFLYDKKVNEKYQEWYNFVIPNSISSDALLSKIDKKTCSRPYLHMDIDGTPTLSQSIGQDNLGNIISALVDIYVLSLEEGYTGALLCIDEFDVSLHPDTQIRLLDLFDRLADELNIQFVLSTHSLTILKEMSRKEQKSSDDFRIVYLKSLQAPYVSSNKAYEFLEADMFDKLTFERPKVRIYFEDKVGVKIFTLLVQVLETILQNLELENHGHETHFRNVPEGLYLNFLNERLTKLTKLDNILCKCDLIPLVLGCEELIKINDADKLFERMIFILDGDARYKDPCQKPRIKDYLDKKYDPKHVKTKDGNIISLNDRNHKKNICFLPGYFAPESYLYGIIQCLCSKPLEYIDFWRTMDSKEATVLYTPDRISGLFSKLSGDYNNDNIKAIFGNSLDSDVWNFIQESNMLTYYYLDYKNIVEIIEFFEAINDIYEIALKKTLANRY